MARFEIYQNYSHIRDTSSNCTGEHKRVYTIGHKDHGVCCQHQRVTEKRGY